MSIKLSHSAVNKYLSCPKSYQYHYMNRLRPIKQSAALLFGTSIDKACEEYTKDKNLANAILTFNNTWKKQYVNDVEVYLPACTDIVYSNSDIDTGLLSELHWKSFNFSEKQFAYAMVLKDKDGFDNLSQDFKQIINRVAWECMSIKGSLMVAKFAEIFDANVEEVLGTQVEIQLSNDDGDGVKGFADFVFKWKGYSAPIVFDLKTSGIRYEDDSVKKSPQLSLYVHSLRDKYENTNTAGYIVLHKRVAKNKTKVCSVCGFDGTEGRHKSCSNTIDNKRCGGEYIEKTRPEITFQVIVDDIPSVLEDRVIENFTEVSHAIKSEVFPRNFSSCITYNGTVTCPYYSLCHENKQKGLYEKCD